MSQHYFEEEGMGLRFEHYNVGGARQVADDVIILQFQNNEKCINKMLFILKYSIHCN